MGILDVVRPKKQQPQVVKPALEAAADGDADHNAATRMIQTLLNFGLDGAGPLSSAAAVATKELAARGHVEAAVNSVISSHVRTGAAGGFLTGMGGFVTLPVALPINVVEFYVQATRMVGAVATLRGYDVNSEQVRTAVLLTLIGSNADQLLARAGIPMAGGHAANLVASRLGPAARIMINKGVGFQLLKSVGERSLTVLGRGIPVAGGVIGAGFDGYMMKRIGDAARQEFPMQQA